MGTFPRKDQILFAGFLSFMGGAAIASFFIPHQSSVDPAVLFLSAAFLCGWYAVRPSMMTVALLVWLLAGALGYVWTERAFDSFSGMQGGIFSGTGWVVEDPEERLSYRQVVIRPESCGNSFCPEKRILWQAPLTSAVQAGDRFRFQCLLTLPENFDPEFDYRMYLAKERIGYVCKKMDAWEPVSSTWSGEVLRALYLPKHFFEERLSRLVPEPEAGLAKGLLLGGDRYLSEEFKGVFRQVGLSHIVAISGYNITLLIECFLAFGLFLGLWRRQALYAALIGIILFVIMIGLPASAVRAGTMAGLVFLSREAGRLSRPVAILIAAGALIVFVNPLLLRYDIGFQLSFLATLAIAVAMPFEKHVFRREFWGISMLKILWLTLIVNIFILPVLLFHFHIFSPVALVGNTLTLLVPWAMLFSFFGALLTAVIPVSAVGLILSLPAYFTLSLMTRSVEYLGLMPVHAIEVFQFTLFHVFLWYGVLLFVMVGLEKYRKRISRVYPI